MAIIAFIFSSCVGTLMALIGWLWFSVPLGMALALYLAISLLLGLTLITLSTWQPPPSGLKLRPT